jgi:ABC-2 type transport system ATP-binding protein
LTLLLSAHQIDSFYGKEHAVKKVDLFINKGECFGLLGPNGAGKSTLLAILEGIRRPHHGKVLYRDKPLDNNYKKKIGIQFQSTALPDYLTVIECLTLFSSFYPSPTNLNQLVEQCQLEKLTKKFHYELSGGQRQRLLLALSLINDPELLFLDEPTTGLDPNARIRFWELLRNLTHQGKTILLTTHYMEEAEQLCDRIAIMDHGEIMTEQQPKILLSDNFMNNIITLPTKNNFPTINTDQLRTRHQGGQFIVECNDIQIALEWLNNAKISTTGLSIRPPNLEDLYLKLTGSTLST